MRVKLFIILCVLFCKHTAIAQEDLPTDFLSAEFHKGRRNAFKKLMPPNSVAIFFANPVQNRSNDVDFIFHQDPNLYYLSGYREPNGVLVIFSETPKGSNTEYDEILFVQPRNPDQEQWTGYRLGVAGAKEKLGINTVYETKDFIDNGIDFSSFSTVLLSQPKGAYTDDPQNHLDSFDLLDSFLRQMGHSITVPQSNVNLDVSPLRTVDNKIDPSTLHHIMASLRQIKTPEEIELLSKAAKISAIGQYEIMKAMHPKMSETEIQGVHEYIYKKYGSEFEGYPSIVGAGANGCILHYIENNKTKVGNELVLMDLGAEYRGYTADVTRTIPANGQFTEPQKKIYNLVLRAQEAGIEQAIVGSDFKRVDDVSRDIIYKGLLELGIISSLDEGRQYYPHSVGHYLGLDVHDLGLDGAFEENMVITVEPGIYIPEDADCDPKWHGIAVRIEDDIHITKNGPINLSEYAPRTVEQIELLMKEESVLNNFVLPRVD
ncbi:aminopeptidase P N-terminal domain-containing protein [Gelidibacter sp. F63206]|uniref:aminopeptidase P N-terminal domain-containing protein n=1 Tax=Gelidibacter sp. F63206 TaxID=2926425 RepID=UPI001FF4B6D3|nr:aminopeptidase P N-terminal domain-containing protein [Gelidibacter sp. F63206]MCK0115267.1 aminopeptidase P N-terminal domain-containing protein [Gelidibacter sp. F63206]